MGQETPSPIDTSTLEDVSLHDEEIGDDENTNKSSDPHSGNTGAGTTPTSKVSALARKLFKKSESTKFLCENLKKLRLPTFHYRITNTLHQVRFA